MIQVFGWLILLSRSQASRDLQARYDLEAEKDRPGDTLDAIRPLSAYLLNRPATGGARLAPGPPDKRKCQRDDS